ncbi:hypothetical protein MRX96_002819 [Rhipicephalus microplus]
MADIQRSIKDLWVIISGNTNLRSNQLIGIELTKNADQVLNGLLYFTEKRQSKTTVPESFNQELLSKLSTLLGLDKQRSYELFCAYLTYEYRGTPDDLKATVASERNIPHILNEVWNYYRMERLFSLFCLRYILEHWQNPSHEYVKLFDGFLERFNEDEIIIKKIIEQLNMIVDTQPPSRESHGPYMTNTLIGQWVNYTLQEQCELLKIVLLYYKDIQPQLENIIQLLDVFQKHNFGQRSSFRKLLGDSHRSTLDLISYLECLVLVESLDLDWLHRCHLKSMTDHQLLKDSDALQGTGTAGLGKEALRMDAFGYLNDALRHPAFFGDGVLPNKVHAIVYELVFLLVASFNHRSLGPIEPLYRLAVKLLEYPTVAQDFWKEGESSGLGHLLGKPRQLKQCDKQVQSFVPCFLEPLDLVPTGVMRIAEDDSRVWLTATRYPYGSRALFIPYGTEGIVFKSGDSSFVRWQATVNGWQVIICELFKPCDSDKGWLQRLLHIARLIRSLLEADSSLRDLLANNIDELFAALHRLILLSTPLVSPPIEVLGECLEMVAILAGKDPEKSWKRLVATGLLPALRTKPKSVEELIQGYMVTDNVLTAWEMWLRRSRTVQTKTFSRSRHSKDLLNSVRLCFSLLNRLLLVGAGEGSLLEQRLLVSPSQTAGGAPSLTVSVARFLYLRFDPRLCTLAVQLLKRIAKLYPMSLLACLGRDAESFRDQLLLRLSKDTEDVRLKVALLQLLAVCTRTQPGLFELLLGSTTSSPSSAASSGSLGDASLSSSGLGLCLGEVLQILKTKQEGKDYCPADLHCSCVEFIHSLWACHQLRAMELLRKSKSFWSMVCFPLMGEAVVTEQSRLVAFIFKTLALELYHSKNELDSNVKSVLNKAKEGAPIKDWSKLVTSSLPKQSGVGNMSLNASAMSIADTTEMFDPVTDGYVLLSGWRDLCVILAKCRHVQIAPAEKNAILQDLFSSLVAEGVPANFKISIVLGELYLMLLKHWSSNITSTVAEWMSSLDTVLGHSAARHHVTSPAVCPRTKCHWRHHGKCAEEGLKSPSSLSAQVCTTLTTFLKDLLSLSDNNAGCVPILQQNLVVAQLTNLLQVSLQKMKDSRLSQAICHFFLALTALPQVRGTFFVRVFSWYLFNNSFSHCRARWLEVLQCCGVVDQVSPFLSACYQGTDEGWLSVYRLMVQLVTAMLHVGSVTSFSTALWVSWLCTLTGFTLA